MSEISKSAVERIIKKAGAKRVSESAVNELANILESHGVEISRLAVQFAAHGNRATVRDGDIRLAAKIQEVSKCQKKRE